LVQAAEIVSLRTAASSRTGTVTGAGPGLGSEQPPAVSVPSGPQTKPPGAPEKLLTFEMRNKPWSSVLEWLADQTGLPFVGSIPPGTFTFIPPRREEKFTVPQIIDLLNEALAPQKCLLIRRERSFALVPADEKIPGDMLPHLTLSQLKEHGNSEVAQVVLPLKALVAKDTEKEIRKMLGPFGDVVALTGPNQLLVSDTIRNLKFIRKIIESTDDDAKGGGTFLDRGRSDQRDRPGQGNLDQDR
jgi:type II secretory pathway component GspD/PulD (secretin)